MLMETQGPGAMYGVTITLTILNCMAVPMRFYRRKKQKQTLMADDWLVVPALVSENSRAINLPSLIYQKALNIGMSIAIWIGKLWLSSCRSCRLRSYSNVGKTGVSKHAVGYPTPPVTQTQDITARTPLDQVGEVISVNEKVSKSHILLCPESNLAVDLLHRL